MKLAAVFRKVPECFIGFVGDAMKRLKNSRKSVFPGIDLYVLVCILLSMDSRRIIQLLIADGWFQVAQEGDHLQFKHRDKSGRVTIPHPVKDIPDGTLGSIRRQSGLTLRENIKSLKKER